MIEATEADKRVANSIMETCQGDYGEEVWIGSGHNAGISLRQEIALALATAREEGRRQGFYLVQEAMDRKGIVDCTNVDAAGMVVRKVNGKLPVTKDGVVWIDRTAPLYTHLTSCGYYMHGNGTIPVAVRDETAKCETCG